MRLEIIELDGENVISLLYQRKTAGLAGYISQGVMSREGVNVLLGVLGNFHVLIQLAQVQAVHCLATASLRVLKNASVVLAEIKEKFGLDVRVLTGDEEALVSFAGSRDLMDDRPSLFVDLGGGSTELVRVERRGPVRSVSLPFGALVLYHRFIRGILPTEAERDQMELF
jgi:exopolyphosphatase/guanosine-5'-triphosphate,3'-diphosphate pyrophosphatase